MNLGNMCFANTVLQILVYCAPVYKLFTELGKYAVAKGEKKDSNQAGKGTPLVDAT